MDNSGGRSHHNKRKRAQQEQKSYDDVAASTSAGQLMMARHLDASLLSPSATPLGQARQSHQLLQSATSLQQQNRMAEALFSSRNFPLVNPGGPLSFRGLPQLATARIQEGIFNPFLSSSSLNILDTSRLMDQQPGALLSQSAIAASLEPTPRGFLHAPPTRFPSLASTSQPSRIPNLPISMSAALGSSLGASMGASMGASVFAPSAASSLPGKSSLTEALLAQEHQALHKTDGRSSPGSLAASSASANNLAMATTSTSASSTLTGRPSVVLYMPCDDAVISAYQCLARKQMELFEAKDIDVEAGAQGRNRGIVLGQVGIRCRHCSHLYPRRRTKSSTFYPSKLKSTYQCAQNCTNTHLTQTCQYIPPAIREELQKLSQDKKTSAGGGKEYWSDGARILGVYETETHLRFQQHSDYPGAMRGGAQPNY